MKLHEDINPSRYCAQIHELSFYTTYSCPYIVLDESTSHFFPFHARSHEDQAYVSYLRVYLRVLKAIHPVVMCMRNEKKKMKWKKTNLSF